MAVVLVAAAGAGRSVALAPAAHVEDARWTALADAKVSADPAAGEYRAVFGPSLSRLQGRELTLSGYMLPLGTDPDAPHFVLTRRSAGCPFCPPEGPNEAVEVTARGRVAYTLAPVTVSGRLRLVDRSGTGLFFRLEGAVLR